MRTPIGKKENVLIVVIGLLFFLLFLYRSFYGFAWNDEPFYISSANRLYMGDVLFKDEWQRSQISAILLLPLVALYRYFMGTTEGIVLFFRQAYLLFSVAVAIYTYLFMAKRKGKWCALAIALMYFSYAKLSVATFSYNTNAETFFLLSILQLIQFWEGKGDKLGPMIRTGILYSIVVIANPYFILGFLIFISIIVWNIRNKSENICKHANSLKGIGLGILISLIIFCFFFIRMDTVGNIFENFSNIMNSEDSYGTPFIRKTLQMFNSVVKVYWITIIPYLFMVGYILYAKQYKKMFLPKICTYIKGTNIIILLINIFMGMQDKKNIGVSFIAFGMFGVVQALSNVEKYKKEIVCWMLPGLTAAVTFYYASDTGLISIAAGCLYIAIGATIIVFEEIKGYSLKRIMKEKWLLASTIGVVLVIISTAYFRIFYIFREPSLDQLNTKIMEGPAKGIYTTEENWYEYAQIYKLIQTQITKDDTVYFSKFLPWGYLSTDARCGAYSTWLIPMADEGLERYYKLNPEKIPNVIVLLDEDIGYKNDNNPLKGYVYEEIIKKQNYKKSVVDGATIYRVQP